MSGPNQDRNRTVKRDQCTLVKGSTLRAAFQRGARGRVLSANPPAASADAPEESAGTPALVQPAPGVVALSPEEAAAKARAYAARLFGEDDEAEE